MVVLRGITLQFCFSCDRPWLWMPIFLGFMLSSCGQNKLSQCEQIFKIAQSVTDSSKNISYTQQEELTEMKNWLEVAQMMNVAANKIEALHINDGNLIPYQNQLINIYRIYSQATYDAVQARESKNFEALQNARIEAQKAGEMQQEVVQDLNSYCLRGS